METEQEQTPQQQQQQEETPTTNLENTNAVTAASASATVSSPRGTTAGSGVPRQPRVIDEKKPPLKFSRSNVVSYNNSVIVLTNIEQQQSSNNNNLPEENDKNKNINSSSSSSKKQDTSSTNKKSKSGSNKKTKQHNKDDSNNKNVVAEEEPTALSRHQPSNHVNSIALAVLPLSDERNVLQPKGKTGWIITEIAGTPPRHPHGVILVVDEKSRNIICIGGELSASARSGDDDDDSNNKYKKLTGSFQNNNNNSTFLSTNRGGTTSPYRYYGFDTETRLQQQQQGGDKNKSSASNSSVAPAKKRWEYWEKRHPHRAAISARTTGKRTEKNIAAAHHQQEQGGEDVYNNNIDTCGTPGTSTSGSRYDLFSTSSRSSTRGGDTGVVLAANPNSSVAPFTSRGASMRRRKELEKERLEDIETSMLLGEIQRKQQQHEEQQQDELDHHRYQQPQQQRHQRFVDDDDEQQQRTRNGSSRSSSRRKHSSSRKRSRNSNRNNNATNTSSSSSTLFPHIHNKQADQQKKESQNRNKSSSSSKKSVIPRRENQPDIMATDIHVAHLDGIRTWRSIPLRRAFPIGFAAPVLLSDGRILLHGGLTGSGVPNQSLLVCDIIQGTTDVVIPDTKIQLKEHKAYLRPEDENEVAYLILFSGLINHGVANGKVYMIPINMKELRRSGSTLFYTHVDTILASKNTSSNILVVDSPSQWDCFDSQNFAWEYQVATDTVVCVSIVSDYCATLKCGDVIDACSSKSNNNEKVSAEKEEETSSQKSSSSSNENVESEVVLQEISPTTTENQKEEGGGENNSFWKEQGTYETPENEGGGDASDFAVANNGTSADFGASSNQQENNVDDENEDGENENDDGEYYSEGEDDDEDEDDDQFDLDASDDRLLDSSTLGRSTLGDSSLNLSVSQKAKRKRQQRTKRKSTSSKISSPGVSLRNAKQGNTSVFDFIDISGAVSVVSADNTRIVYLSDWKIRSFDIAECQRQEGAKIRSVAHVVPALNKTGEAAGRNSPLENYNQNNIYASGNNSNVESPNNNNATTTSLPLINIQRSGKQSHHQQQNAAATTPVPTSSIVTSGGGGDGGRRTSRSMSPNNPNTGAAGANTTNSSSYNNTYNSSHGLSYRQQQQFQQQHDSLYYSAELLALTVPKSGKQRRHGGGYSSVVSDAVDLETTIGLSGTTSKKSSARRDAIAKAIVTGLESGSGVCSVSSSSEQLSGEVIFDLDMLFDIPLLVLKRMIPQSSSTSENENETENENNTQNANSPVAAIENKKKEDENDNNENNEYDDDEFGDENASASSSPSSSAKKSSSKELVETSQENKQEQQEGNNNNDDNNNNNKKKKKKPCKTIKTIDLQGGYINDGNVQLFVQFLTKHPNIIHVVGCDEERTPMHVAHKIEQALQHNEQTRENRKQLRAVKKALKAEQEMLHRHEFSRSPIEVQHQKRERFMISWEETVVREEMLAAYDVHAAETHHFLRLMRRRAAIEKAALEEIEQKRLQRLRELMDDVVNEEAQQRQLCEDKLFAEAHQEAREIRSQRQALLEKYRAELKRQKDEQKAFLQEEKSHRQRIVAEHTTNYKDFAETYRPRHEEIKKELLRIKKEQEYQEEQRILEENRRRREEDRLVMEEQRRLEDFQKAVDKIIKDENRDRQDISVRELKDTMDREKIQVKEKFIAEALAVRRCREAEKAESGKKPLSFKVEGLEKRRVLCRESVGSITVIEPESMSEPKQLKVSTEYGYPPCFREFFKQERDEIPNDAWMKQKAQILRVRLLFSLPSSSSTSTSSSSSSSNEKQHHHHPGDRLILDSEKFILEKRKSNSENLSCGEKNAISNEVFDVFLPSLPEKIPRGVAFFTDKKKTSEIQVVISGESLLALAAQGTSAASIVSEQQQQSHGNTSHSNSGNNNADNNNNIYNTSAIGGGGGYTSFGSSYHSGGAGSSAFGTSSLRTPASSPTTTSSSSSQLLTHNDCLEAILREVAPIVKFSRQKPVDDSEHDLEDLHVNIAMEVDSLVPDVRRHFFDNNLTSGVAGSAAVSPGRDSSSRKSGAGAQSGNAAFSMMGGASTTIIGGRSVRAAVGPGGVMVDIFGKQIELPPPTVIPPIAVTPEEILDSYQTAPFTLPKNLRSRFYPSSSSAAKKGDEQNENEDEIEIPVKKEDDIVVTTSKWEDTVRFDHVQSKITVVPAESRKLMYAESHDACPLFFEDAFRVDSSLLSSGRIGLTSGLRLCLSFEPEIVHDQDSMQWIYSSSASATEVPDTNKIILVPPGTSARGISNGSVPVSGLPIVTNASTNSQQQIQSPAVAGSTPNSPMSAVSVPNAFTSHSQHGTSTQHHTTTQQHHHGGSSHHVASQQQQQQQTTISNPRVIGTIIRRGHLTCPDSLLLQPNSSMSLPIPPSSPSSSKQQQQQKQQQNNNAVVILHHQQQEDSLNNTNKEEEEEQNDATLVKKQKQNKNYKEFTIDYEYYQQELKYITEIELAKDCSLQDLQRLVSSIGFQNNSRDPSSTPRKIRVGICAPALRQEQNIDLGVTVECFDDPVEIDFGLGGGCHSIFHTPLAIPRHLAKNIRRPFFFALFGQIIDVDTKFIYGGFMEIEIMKPLPEDRLGFVPRGAGGSCAFERVSNSNVITELIPSNIIQQMKLCGAIPSASSGSGSTTAAGDNTNTNNQIVSPSAAAASATTSTTRPREGSVINRDQPALFDASTINFAASSAAAGVSTAAANNNNGNNEDGKNDSFSYVAPRRIATIHLFNAQHKEDNNDEITNRFPKKIRFDLEAMPMESLTLLLRCVEFNSHLSKSMFEKGDSRNIKVTVQIDNGKKKNKKSKNVTTTNNNNGVLEASTTSTAIPDNEKNNKKKEKKTKKIKTWKKKKQTKKVKKQQTKTISPSESEFKEFKVAKEQAEKELSDYESNKLNLQTQVGVEKAKIEKAEKEQAAESSSSKSSSKEKKSSKKKEKKEKKSKKKNDDDDDFDFGDEDEDEDEFDFGEDDDDDTEEDDEFDFGDDNNNNSSSTITKNIDKTALIAAETALKNLPPPPPKFTREAPKSKEITEEIEVVEEEEIQYEEEEEVTDNDNDQEDENDDFDFGDDDEKEKSEKEDDDGGSDFDFGDDDDDKKKSSSNKKNKTSPEKKKQEQQKQQSQQEEKVEDEQLGIVSNICEVRLAGPLLLCPRSKSHLQYKEESGLMNLCDGCSIGFDDDGWDGGSVYFQMISGYTCDDFLSVRDGQGITLEELEPGDSSLLRRPLRQSAYSGHQQKNSPSSSQHRDSLSQNSSAQQQQQQQNPTPSSSPIHDPHSGILTRFQTIGNQRRIAGTMKRRRMYFASLRQRVRDDVDDSFRTKLGLDDTGITTQCRVLLIDGKRVGVVHIKQSALWIGFDENLDFDKLSRKEMCSLQRSDVARVLKNVCYTNDSNAPRCLNKTVVMSACDGLQHASTAVIDLQVLATDTVTEFSLQSLDPIIYKMSDPSHSPGLFRPLENVVMDDPDTFYFNGQTLWVDISAGGDVHSDQLGILSVEEQKKEIELKNKNGNNNLAGSMNMMMDAFGASQSSATVLSEGMDRSISKANAEQAIVNIDSISGMISFEGRYRLNNENENNNNQQQQQQQQLVELGVFHLDTPSTDETTSICIRFNEVNHDVVKTEKLQQIGRHDEAAQYPSLVTIDDVTRILNLITYHLSSDRFPIKTTQRQITMRIGHGKKVGDGIKKVDIQVQGPVLTLPPTLNDAMLLTRMSATSVLQKLAFTLPASTESSDKTLVREGKLTLTVENAGSGDMFGLPTKKLDGFQPPPKTMSSTLTGSLNLPSSQLACQISSTPDRRNVTLSFHADSHISVKQLNQVLRLFNFTCGDMDPDLSSSSSGNNNVFTTKAEIQERAARTLKVVYEVSEGTNLIRSEVSLRVWCGTTLAKNSPPICVHGFGINTTTAGGFGSSITGHPLGNDSVTSQTEQEKEKESAGGVSGVKHTSSTVHSDSTTQQQQQQQNKKPLPALPKISFSKPNITIMRGGNFTQVLPSFSVSDIGPWLLGGSSSSSSSGGNPLSSPSTVGHGSNKNENFTGVSKTESSVAGGGSPTSLLPNSQFSTHGPVLSIAITIGRLRPSICCISSTNNNNNSSQQHQQQQDTLMFRNAAGDLVVTGEIAQTEVPTTASIAQLHIQGASMQPLAANDPSVSPSAAAAAAASSASSNKKSSDSKKSHKKDSKSGLKVALLEKSSSSSSTCLQTTTVTSPSGEKSNNKNNFLFDTSIRNTTSALDPIFGNNRLVILPYPGVCTAAGVEGILKGVGISIANNCSNIPASHPDRLARRVLFFDFCVNGVINHRSVVVIEIAPTLLTIPRSPGMRVQPPVFVNTVSNAQTEVFSKILVPHTTYSHGAQIVVTLTQPPKLFFLVIASSTSAAENPKTGVTLVGKGDIVVDKKKVANLTEQTNKFTFQFSKNTNSMIIQRVLRSIALESYTQMKNSVGAVSEQQAWLMERSMNSGSGGLAAQTSASSFNNNKRPSSQQQQQKSNDNSSRPQSSDTSNIPHSPTTSANDVGLLQLMPTSTDDSNDQQQNKSSSSETPSKKQHLGVVTPSSGQKRTSSSACLGNAITGIAAGSESEVSGIVEVAFLDESSREVRRELIRVRPCYIPPVVESQPETSFGSGSTTGLMSTPSGSSPTLMNPAAASANNQQQSHHNQQPSSSSKTSSTPKPPTPRTPSGPSSGRPQVSSKTKKVAASSLKDEEEL